MDGVSVSRSPSLGGPVGPWPSSVGALVLVVGVCPAAVGLLVSVVGSGPSVVGTFFSSVSVVGVCPVAVWLSGSVVGRGPSVIGTLLLVPAGKHVHSDIRLTQGPEPVASG
jgi:hypothetical protein